MRLRFDRKVPAPRRPTGARRSHEVIALLSAHGEAALRRAARRRRRGEERRGKLPDGGEIVDLAWPSTYEPALAAIRAQTTSRTRTNRRACARLFRHGGSGARGDDRAHARLSRRARSSSRSARFRCAGCTGSGSTSCSSRCRFTRCAATAERPPWPSANPARCNEGFGQAIHDLRALVKWLRAAEAGDGRHEPRRLHDGAVRDRRAARIRRRR